MLKSLCKMNMLRDGELHEENQYLNLISDILNQGDLQKGRNGTTKAIFGSAMEFSLKNNSIPILTTKKTAWKTCLKELLWFINGNTNNDDLQKQNVKIWNANSSREFLDSRGLYHRKENDLGPIYGFQWRHFNAAYSDCHANYDKQGIDQLQIIIDNLKNPETRTSRRLVMSAWNPCQLNEMALPPCHVLAQFSVIDDKLSCALYQRSGDVGLGVPFNIASYSFLTHLLAKHCGLQADSFCYFLGNTHIYDDHFNSLSSQIMRKPYPFPKLNITRIHDNINDYQVDDFTLLDYQCHKKVTMVMRK